MNGRGEEQPIEKQPGTAIPVSGGQYCRLCSAWRGEHGLEPTLALWLEHEVAIWRAVRRVLKKTGTVWLNVGDAYNAYNGGAGPSSSLSQTQSAARPQLASGYGLREKAFKPKDRLGLPHRLVFALQDDGWWWRDEIVWHKPNPMPSSVRDRTTPAHEMLFMLSKSARYFYDQEAVREADKGTDHPRHVLHRPEPSGGVMAPHMGIRKADGRNGAGRNLRSVWTITTEPFPEAHFATAPTKLVDPCIKAGTSEKGVCSECGAPWVRLIEGEPMEVRDGPKSAVNRAQNRTAASGTMTKPPKHRTLGWSPSCACDAKPVPATVLDIFGGSGTTALVADRLGRNAILIELQPEYVEIARRRVFGDAPLFTEAAQ